MTLLANSVLMIAVAQLDLVGVAIAINDSILIQGGIVGHNDSGTLTDRVCNVAVFKGKHAE